MNAGGAHALDESDLFIKKTRVNEGASYAKRDRGVGSKNVPCWRRPAHRGRRSVGRMPFSFRRD